MAHSKRNTSRAVFTSHERALAKSHWSSNTARLSRDSFLPFGSCGLCLGDSRDPVACRRGDIFCRECALSNLLAQKKDIKRALRANQAAEEDNARARAVEDREDRDRAVQDFELTQVGLERGVRGGRQGDDVFFDKEDTSSAAGTKRKFALDDDELDRIAKEDKTKARKAIDDEKAAKPTLPSFWTPSLTPDVQASKLPPVAKKAKTVPTCPSSSRDDPHALSMQNLITIVFSEDEDSKTKEKRRVCPSCLKVLSNSSTPMMATQCGHVLCQSCVKQFMMPTSRSSSEELQAPLACYVCDTPLSSKLKKSDAPQPSATPGLVALKSEGTGFSARGTSTVERTSIAFQC
ncbi:hypothetical protein G7046_g2267 [Stylonectria norvegica]|nr:hypothetical protein G7046_g2267 [Stylonectria norvegica]